MHPHYVVVEDFIDKFGTPHVRGDMIVVGDTTPAEVLVEIEVQLSMGTIREVQSGEGVMVPGIATGIAEEEA